MIMLLRSSPFCPSLAYPLRLLFSPLSFLSVRSASLFVSKKGLKPWREALLWLHTIYLKQNADTLLRRIYTSAPPGQRGIRVGGRTYASLLWVAGVGTHLHSAPDPFPEGRVALTSACPKP